jgi:hypothetical protein
MKSYHRIQGNQPIFPVIASLDWDRVICLSLFVPGPCSQIISLSRHFVLAVILQYQTVNGAELSQH